MKEPQKKSISKHLKEKASSYGKNLKRKKISYLHKLFRNKGSGFYGVGYIVTLLYLEVSSFLEEVSEFSFSFDNLLGQIISHIISFSFETIVNLIKATIWPVIVYSNFNQTQAIALLSVMAVLYFYANKRWNIAEVYEKKFGIQSATEISKLWHNKNPKFGDSSPLIIEDDESILYQLAIDARQKRLENWRHQPESCFALIVLLQSDSKKKVPSYCSEIIFSAIDEKIDVDMSLQQQFYFYQGALNSPSKKQQKILDKAYSKLRKQLPQSDRAMFDKLIEQQ